MMELNKYIILDTQLIEQAIEMIELNASRCVVVLNNYQKVVGVLSEGDILRSILKGVSIKSPIKNILVTNFKYLREFDNEKIMILFKKGITLIPILTEENELNDIVTFIGYFENK